MTRARTVAQIDETARAHLAAHGEATPGQWRVAGSFKGIYSVAPSPGPVQVCRAPEQDFGKWAVNAPLLAAAPDLLDALQTVWDAYGFDPSIDSSIWQTVQAAIARARGEAQ